MELNGQEVKFATLTKMCLVVVIWAWIFITFNVQSLVTQIALANVDDQPSSQAVRKSSSGSDQICPAAAKLFDPKSLEEMVIEKAKDFHQRGGNLKSIENYLNGAIQETLDRLNIKFEFNDPEENKKGVRGGGVQDLLSYYKTHQVPRGGYGQPLPGKWTGDNAGKQGPLQDKRWIDVLEPSKSDRHKVAIGNVSPCLKEMKFNGGSYGEGKSVCVPPDFDENPITEDCNFFSIGSNDQWGFEQEVVKKLPHCVTHTFDCTLQDHQPRKKPVSDNVVFHPYCIGGDNSVRSTKRTNSDNLDNYAPGAYLPYHEMWKFLDTTKPPKLLKIDVEGFEFGVVPSMLRNSPSKIWPEQIAMEVHWSTRMVDEPTMLRTRTAAEISLFFGNLFNYGGYLPVNVKYFDIHCPPCLEVLMVRVLCRDE